MLWNRYVRLGLISTALSAAAIAAPASAETGQIEAFKKLPMQTFELNGQRSRTLLGEADLPADPGAVDVRGWWPTRKLLLIEIENEGYYIHYRSVEMKNKALWDQRMTAQGDLVCLGGSQARGGSGSDGTAYGSKGFSSPC